MIPKFKDVLLNDELEAEKVRDALKTLNECVSHQVSLNEQLEDLKLTPLFESRKHQTR